MAEDNLINQKVVLKMLAGFGYTADLANIGRDASHQYFPPPATIGGNQSHLPIALSV
jgi:CheY-like chemotaxis protein